MSLIYGWGLLITSNWLFCSSSYFWAVLQSPRLGARSAPAGSAMSQCDVHINGHRPAFDAWFVRPDTSFPLYCGAILMLMSPTSSVGDSITLASLTSVASSPAHSRDRGHLSTTMSSWRTKMSICANYVSKYQSSSISTHYNGIWRSILEKSLKKLEWWNRLWLLMTVWLEVKLAGWSFLAPVNDPKLSNQSQIQRHKSAESSSCNIGF